MRTREIKITLLISVALCAAVVLPLSARGSYQKKADYSLFTHKTHLGAVKIPGSEETQELKCDSCHERQVSRAARAVATTERNDRLQLNFPGHNACVECHIVQFTLRQTCAICHNRDQGLTAFPPQRDFPARRDYNAYFDGKQHVDHVNKYALPNGGKLDCGYCHKPTPKQAARTIASHSECYVCHAPGSGDAKASLKADCGVCHRSPAKNEKIEPFSAKYKSRAYGASFTHQTHITYAGEKMCDACHTIEGAYNQPLPAPSKIRVKEHLSPGERSGRGCFSCHDGGTHYGRAVFSGESSCAKCHKDQDKNGRFRVRATDG
jgi:hypothetical protein